MSETTAQLPADFDAVELDECRKAIQMMAADLIAISCDTEQGAINIGNALKEIVRTVTDGNRDVKRALKGVLGRDNDKGKRKSDGDESRSKNEGVSEIVERQIDIVTSIVSSSKDFFHKQMKIAEQANNACSIINSAVKNVETLTKTSNMLSINLRIEASRLDEEEADGFTALGAEVQQFAKELAVATEQITNATELLAGSVPQIRDSTVAINEKMSKMASGFDVEVDQVREKIEQMTTSLTATVGTTEDCNAKILEHSNEILSSLSFQDPMAQGLVRISKDILEVKRMLNGEKPVFGTLQKADEKDAQEAGEITFF